MSEQPGTVGLRLRLATAVLRLACALAPPSRSDDLESLWLAELQHRSRLDATSSGQTGRTSLLRWSLGSFVHSFLAIRQEFSMDILRQDLRFALRSLARHPTVVFVATLSLALGIGANTAIWSAIDQLLVRPLPYPQPQELVL